MKSILHVYDFNLGYAKMLMEDIVDEQMCQQPAGVVNHPAWTLGHLIAGSAGFAGKLLGVDVDLPDDWQAKYGMGSTPTAERSDYPSKGELLSELEKAHKQIADAASQLDTAALDQPMPDEEFRKLMPTVGDALVFILINHEATHLGQLATWRQAMGLPRLMT